MNREQISSLRLKDLDIFIEVSRAKSIREVARRTGLTPGQVSKSIQALESKIGVKLYRRSVSGVLPTAHGTELLTIAKDFISCGERIHELVSGKTETRAARVLSVASTSFLNTHIIAPTICSFADEVNETKFRFLDLPPDQMTSVALRSGFEIAVHFRAISWPATWQSQKVGSSPWLLCARARHPLADRSSLKQILEYPFVVPTYWSSEGLTSGNDQFPLPISKRRTGFETQTADAAIPILLSTNQIAFLPKVLAKPWLKGKKLRAISCPEIAKVDRDLYVSARTDIVSHRLFERLKEKLAQEIASG